MEQQRRADVVGEIANGTQFLAELRKIECQGVGLVQGELRRWKVAAQPRSQIAVNLDRGKVTGSREKTGRERGKARPDLDDVIAAPRIDRIENARYVMRIDEKVLTESAPRSMPATIELGLRHGGGTRMRRG